MIINSTVIKSQMFIGKISEAVNTCNESLKRMLYGVAVEAAGAVIMEYKINIERLLSKIL